MSAAVKLLGIFKRSIRWILGGVPIKHVTAQVTTLAQNELLMGRNALITGGSSGIGKEIAKAFINSGANVVITGRDKNKLDSTCKEIEETTGKNGRIHSIIMDNSDINSFDETLKSIVTKIGEISILVNNAGTVNFKNFGHTTEDDYDRIMDVNLKSTYFLSQAIAKYMINNNIEGNILNIASSSSLRPANSPYSLSKWGVKGLTIGLARVLTEHNIVVNGIAPGPTATPMLGINKNGNIAHEKNLTGRHALPEEIASMATILVSNMSRTICGDIIYMSGGSGNVITNDINYEF